jgi:glycosyltransferase involved in cell wall biosynthesis
MYTISLVSIIIPSFNEAGNIPVLANEIVNVMSTTKYKYEIFFVNDGSSDKSWEAISLLSGIYPQINGLDLAGNYGQTIAISAGIKASKGDVIVLMDGDMQHDPAYIPEFLTHIENGFDMVSGAKEKRPENFIKAAMANLAHGIICKVSGVKLKYFGATFKVYRRFLFDNINLLGDTHRYLGALVVRKGTKYIELPIKIRNRNAGKSNYKLNKAFLVIVDLIFLKFSVSYMNKPFRLFGVVGLILFLIGGAFASYYILGSLFLHWYLGKNYLIEFISSIFTMLFAVLLFSFGIIAQIGVFNYYTKSNQDPFTIREMSVNNQTNAKTVNY